MGVESAALQNWKAVVGDQGRLLLTAHIDSVSNYYIEMTKAKNHEISEAACHSIAELVSKLDQEAVRPMIPDLVVALHACLLDPSWPVRDAACVATGVMVRHFPVETESYLDSFLVAWFSHLKDAIWSIRENAAVGKPIHQNDYTMCVCMYNLLSFASARPNLAWIGDGCNSWQSCSHSL